MKRFFCLLLCLLVPLSACANESWSVLDVMARQVTGTSALRVFVTLTPEGDTPAFCEEQTWNTLKALLTGLEGRLSYTFVKAGKMLDNSQMVLALYRDDARLTSLTLHGRQENFYLSGEALGDTTLSFPRDVDTLLRSVTLPPEDWGALALRDASLFLGALSPQSEEAWPSLSRLGVLLLTETAQAQQELDTLLAPYDEAVSAWLQARARLTLEKRADGTLGTVSTVTASLPDCAQEALSLLRMFYQDDALRAFLRQRMTLSEAQAYLEEGMLPLLEQLLCAVPEAGELSLLRRYNEQGDMDAFSLSLPFGDGARVVLSRSLSESTLAYFGAELSLTLTLAGQEGSYQGTYSLSSGEKQFSGAYQLYAAHALTYDELNTGAERQENGLLTLLLTPDDALMPPQSLTLALNGVAGKDTRQAVHMSIEAEWKDLSGTAGLRANVRAYTQSALKQSEPAEGALSLQDLEDAQRALLLQQAAAFIWQKLLPLAID